MSSVPHEVNADATHLLRRLSSSKMTGSCAVPMFHLIHLPLHQSSRRRCSQHIAQPYLSAIRSAYCARPFSAQTLQVKLDVPGYIILYTRVHGATRLRHLSFDRQQRFRCATFSDGPPHDENHVRCCSLQRRMCVQLESTRLETCLHVRRPALSLRRPISLHHPCSLQPRLRRLNAWMLNALDPFAELRCFKVIAAIVAPSLRVS